MHWRLQLSLCEKGGECIDRVESDYYQTWRKRFAEAFFKTRGSVWLEQDGERIGHSIVDVKSLDVLVEFFNTEIEVHQDCSQATTKHYKPTEDQKPVDVKEQLESLLRRFSILEKELNDMKKKVREKEHDRVEILKTFNEALRKALDYTETRLSF